MTGRPAAAPKSLETDTQFIGNRFTDVTDAAGFQFFFCQYLDRPHHVTFDVAERVGSNNDLLDRLDTGRSMGVLKLA